MDLQFLQYIITQGGVAAFAIYMLVKAYQHIEEIVTAGKAEAERYALLNREDKILLLATLDKTAGGYSVIITKLDTMQDDLGDNSKRLEGLRLERRDTATKP